MQPNNINHHSGIEVCGLDLEFRTVAMDDRTPTGAQIAAAAGFPPAADATVLQILANRELEDIRPTEVVNLDSGLTRFIVAEGSESYRFTIDGVRYDWPSRAITGAVLRKLVSVPENKVLYFERRDQADQQLRDLDSIDLADAGVEHFYTAAKPQFKVTIVVEGTPHEWLKESITYAEVVTLEVPDYHLHPEITYSVSYKKGPGNKPEGVLPPGASTKVKEGMVFYVSETGQS